MPEELILSRSRFILRLFEQNFDHVQGPRFVGPGSETVEYRVWRREANLEDAARLDIVFERDLLIESNDMFARTTLHTLGKAKRMLCGGEESMHGQEGSAEGFHADKGIRIEHGPISVET